MARSYLRTPRQQRRATAFVLVIAASLLACTSVAAAGVMYLAQHALR